MKKTVWVIALLFITLQIQAQVEETAYANFYPDSTYYIIADKANVRSNADTTAKVVDQLVIGQKIKILQVTDQTYTKNGYTANWYKVQYNQKETKSEGYIWGGLIASKTIKSITDKEMYYMYAVNKVVKLEYYDEVYLQVRACKNNTELAKLDIKAVGSISTYNAAESMGAKGVKGVKDIFKINFSDGYCAGSFGDAYFFWDGKTLLHVTTLYEGFDAPYSATNVFIFPTDEKGKKGYIINKSESGFYGDDDKFHIEDWERITYKWDGSKLAAVKTEKKK
jgi:Bacterial SH3 domain